VILAQLENARHALGSPLDDRRTPREQINVARKRSTTMHGHELVIARVDGDLTLDDHEHRVVPDAPVPEDGAVPESPLASDRGDASDLLGRQDREDLVLVRFGHHGRRQYSPRTSSA
jgi:hypothetical protein